MHEPVRSSLSLLISGKRFSIIVLLLALTKNCFPQAVWHHQSPSRGLLVCQGEESPTGTLKAKQIKRDWGRLTSSKKAAFFLGTVKSVPGSVCLCAS